MYLKINLQTKKMKTCLMFQVHVCHTSVLKTSKNTTYTGTHNKKLSCRRQTARYLVSSDISLGHSKSLKIIRNGTSRRKRKIKITSKIESIVVVGLKIFTLCVSPTCKWRLSKYHKKLSTTFLLIPLIESSQTNQRRDKCIACSVNVMISVSLITDFIH